MRENEWGVSDLLSPPGCFLEVRYTIPQVDMVCIRIVLDVAGEGSFWCSECVWLRESLESNQKRLNAAAAELSVGVLRDMWRDRVEALHSEE